MKEMPAYQKAVKDAKKLIPDKYGVSETSGLKATVAPALKLSTLT